MDDAAPVAADGDSTATLLVVDDVEENRDILVRRLRRDGYTMLAAATGEEALARVAAGGVDLVLLDIMMPGMDGFEVLRRLRADPASADLPVVMVTAKDEGEDLDRAFELGADDHIAKPVNIAQCRARVKKVLRRRSPTDAKRGALPVQTTAAANAAPAVGSVLAGKYRLDGTLGTGNFGTVYRAQHLSLDRPVAVKVLQTRIADPDALARFESEGRSTVQVRHPNAVEVFDFDITDGIAYLVMELLEGEPLARDLRRRGRFSPHRAIDLLVPVCEVLADAHARDLVHRDIKPENIFLHSPEGADEEVVKVLDFGIAKLVGEHVSRENLTAEGFVLGTPAFLAPERLRNQPYDGRSDVYSLGVILFRMLAGRLPFIPQKDDPMALLMMHLKQEPPAPSDFVDDVPEVLEALALECLAKKAEDRPEAGELADRLRAAAETLPRQPVVAVGGLESVDADAPTHQIDSDRVAQSEREETSNLFGRLVDRFFGGGS